MEAGDQGAAGAGSGDVVEDDAVEFVDIVGVSTVLQKLGSRELGGSGI